jgi:hypothetical protein
MEDGVGQALKLEKDSRGTEGRRGFKIGGKKDDGVKRRSGVRREDREKDERWVRR